MKIFDDRIFAVWFLKEFSKQYVRVKWKTDQVLYPDELSAEIDMFWQSLPPGKFFNGALVRLDDYCLAEKLTVHLSPLNYKTLLYSNANVESVISEWGEQLLAKIVSVSVVYLSVDDMLILMQRSMNVGEYPGYIDVFGGHIDVPSKKKPDIFAAMQQEICEEMNLTAMHHSLSLIALIESVPNRKPEFVFYAKSVLNHVDIRERISSAQDQFEFVDIITVAKQDLAEYLAEKKEIMSPSAFASLCCYHELY